ncbi:hypothetical protein BU23DRAFT_41498 [Bimuria novae-zelandiae CBS 107.79]|uniref:Uncharacterized protein n=1 Tax=Bimuria novae-zelandiae CBS 107.79 TaxID=1447943 RepID=A0A6A5UPT4_9PLEO|nr:hypothetical protein BU23DRAFT_41498 [Bimuria novae-zelandiae CBS 107.79]
MDPLYSWAAFLVLAGALSWYYGLLDKALAKKNESGPNRGRTRSRADDTKIPDWAESDSKKPAAKPAKKAAPRKSVKKAVQEVGSKAEAALSSVTSATGAVAEKETSDETPSLATQVADMIPSGKDVSDMLDAKSISNVLKINASEKPARPAKPQQKKSESETQTKKQAQNAKKRAAEKEAIAKAEAERKKLMEKQLAGAREARGEAPGSRYHRPTQPPASNAWNNGPAPAVKEPANGELLDTFDATSIASSATNGTVPTPDSTSYDNLPSEEDQIAAALADSAWTTVPKGKKKKTKTNGEAVGEGSDSGAPSETAPAPVKAAPAPAPKKENKKESAKPASRFEVLSEPVSTFNDPRDSDWPVV